ncbi:MAG: glucose-6-phosphate dehydrogenase [Candidatus Magasanikbacteria bacterium]|nr:glucose-6-phosphate dehydrogenase [Candidatus Magasanikbacteria bacterium]
MKAPLTIEIPTILVVLGATGDLVKKKIAPSVYHLYINKRLPTRFRVVGMARREMSNDQFRKQMRADIQERILEADKKMVNEIIERFSYTTGEFSDATSFANLKNELENIDNEWGVCTNKLFYLAVPPEHFEIIFQNMAKVGLNIPCGGELGWTRLLVEKPFGADEKSAKKLFTLLKKYFKEKQLYLIDHYLAKEIVQAILHFRFSNNLFERSWDKSSIERIDVRLLETIGAEDRGAFYDAVGAFKDVGQNHLLQMLATLTMDIPRDMNAETHRARRAEILESLALWTSQDIKHNTFRAQYDGFKSIAGVSPKSGTETYFKLKTELTHPAWQGIPVTLEAGKRCPESKKEIVVTMKHPSLCVACAPDRHIHNQVVFSLAPEDRISIHFWTKTPGFEKKLEERVFNFFLYEHAQKTQYVEEYAELIFNCLMGDLDSFVSEREIMAEWKFTDPVENAWRKNIVPLVNYAPGTNKMIVDANRIGTKAPTNGLCKEMVIIGLGKMGGNMARRMMDQNWKVVGYNHTPDATEVLAKEGLVPAYSIGEAIKKLSPKKIVWLMIPAGKPVDEVLFGKNGLTKYLKKGDMVIDGGNSYYKDTTRRAAKLKKYGIKFLDAGTSGGPGGARRGACLMIGGVQKDFELVEQLFRDFALPGGYQFFAGHGAGHFVKMVHNGIEYGMMQAIAEGFTILKKAHFKLDLTRVSDIYNKGSVIESRLIGWLKNAFEMYGENLKPIFGSVDGLGEGAWTVKTAHEMGVADKVIHEALLFRNRSKKRPNYTGQVVSALRNQFGGHDVAKKPRKKK